MEKDRYRFDKEIFGYLKEEYKIALKCDLKNFEDYEKLRNFINMETVEEEEERIDSKKWRKGKGSKDENKLSGDSIKRHFGFIEYEGKPNSTIRSLLARRLGYFGWDDFYEKAVQKHDPKNTFNTFDMHKLFTMKKGDEITIGWSSDKYCILKYMEDLKFEVVTSYGLRSKPGRIIETTGFRLGKTNGRFVYPDIIIEPILDDDPAYGLIELDLIPEEYLL